MIICSEWFSTKSIWLRWDDTMGGAPIIITGATTDMAIPNENDRARIATVGFPTQILVDFFGLNANLGWRR